MNELFYYSLIESIYILYMYNIYKTNRYFNNPVEVFLQKHIFENNTTMRHSMTTAYTSKICKFGKLVSVFLVILIYLRYRALMNKSSQNIMFYSKIVLIVVMLFSIILNMNAFIYLLPVFAYEIYLIRNNFLKGK